jgi:hypothetical protein
VVDLLSSITFVISISKNQEESAVGPEFDAWIADSAVAAEIWNQQK